MCHMQSVVSLMILFLKSIKQEFKADNFTNYNREEHIFHINKKKYICVRHQMFFFLNSCLTSYQANVPYLYRLKMSENLVNVPFYAP